MEPAYRSVLSAILKLGFRRAAMNLSWRRSPKIGLHSGKASKLKAKKTVFVNEKRGLFFTPSTVRTFFWALPKPPKWWSKVAPKNTQTDAKSHVLSAFPVKRVTNIGSHDGMVRWGLPSKMAQEHQKLDSSTVRWKSFSSSPSRLRSGHRRKIIHCSLNFGSDPATDKKQLILKGFCIENRIFFRFPGVSDPAADV